jgi:peptidoglycan/LPS O-acetylase OafA/YrhL
VPGIIGISWSLAVEEHFYFLLAFLFYFLFRPNLFVRKQAIPIGVTIVCCVCLVLRILVYDPTGDNLYRSYFPTHLRIDSIAFGVLLSYWFMFNQAGFFRFFKKNGILLLVIAGVFIAPVFIWGMKTFFISTIGHTFLYLGFGIVLCSMIVFSATIEKALKKTRLTFIFKTIAWIGFYCFGIYLFHLKVGFIVSNWIRVHVSSTLPRAGYFVIYAAANIMAGVFFTWLIERPFLNIRARYFPGASGIKITEQPE